jgi:hypothetical protein
MSRYAIKSNPFGRINTRPDSSAVAGVIDVDRM